MIRPYTAKDKNDLVKLIRLNTPKYFAATEEIDFINYLDKEVEDYFVVEDKGKVIGSGGINYFLTEGIARISWDVIHPDYQGKGIGTKLLLHRIQHIQKKQNIQSIVVRTSQLAYQFYQKMGFNLKSIEQDFWAKGLDLYLMNMETP